MIWFPAITLWQPWASLIFWGFKDHETRGFPMPERMIGEWVAIQAAARSVRPAELEPGLDAIIRAHWGDTYEVMLPHRKVLGLVRFGPSVLTNRTRPTGEADRLAGNWEPHRHAWPILERVELDEPAPAQGRQGWWRVELEPPPRISEAMRPHPGAD